MKPTRQAMKNEINSALRITTKGLHTDDFWSPVHLAWKTIRLLGYDLTVINTHYGQDKDGNPNEKVWLFEINMGSRKPIHGIITAHGAGTVDNPLSRYDISAYCS